MKIIRYIDNNFEKIFSVLLLLTMVILLSAIVFFRFVLNRGLSFAEELDRMVFVWMVYIGSAYAAQQGAHIRLQAIRELIHQGPRKYISLFADLLWVCFNLFIIKEGINVVASMFKYRYESPALGWSMAYIYIIIPLSFGLMTFRVIQRNIRSIKQSKNITNVT